MERFFARPFWRRENYAVLPKLRWMPRASLFTSFGHVVNYFVTHNPLPRKCLRVLQTIVLLVGIVIKAVKFADVIPNRNKSSPIQIQNFLKTDIAGVAKVIANKTVACMAFINDANQAGPVHW